MNPRDKLNLFVEAVRSSRLRKALGPHVYGLVVKTENGLFAVDPEDGVVGGGLRTSGSWALDELERLSGFVKTDSRVLVVGAHIGTLAIPLSKLCKEVVAIEANPDTYNLLITNLALNSVSNCTAHSVAASDTDGTIEFLQSHHNSGGSKRVPQSKQFIYYYDSPSTISVKAARLDDLLEGKAFDLVVMDIEGSEYFALKGMPQILRQSMTLAIEFLPHHLRNVSGVTVDDFLGVIGDDFTRMTVPSKSKTVGRSEFAAVLNGMFNNDEGDEGLIFEKI